MSDQPTSGVGGLGEGNVITNPDANGSPPAPVTEAADAGVVETGDPGDQQGGEQEGEPEGEPEGKPEDEQDDEQDDEQNDEQDDEQDEDSDSASSSDDDNNNGYFDFTNTTIYDNLNKKMFNDDTYTKNPDWDKTTLRTNLNKPLGLDRPRKKKKKGASSGADDSGFFSEAESSFAPRFRGLGSSPSGAPPTPTPRHRRGNQGGRGPSGLSEVTNASDFSGGLDTDTNFDESEMGGMDTGTPARPRTDNEAEKFLKTLDDKEREKLEQVADDAANGGTEEMMDLLVFVGMSDIFNKIRPRSRRNKSQGGAGGAGQQETSGTGTHAEGDMCTCCDGPIAALETSTEQHTAQLGGVVIQLRDHTDELRNHTNLLEGHNTRLDEHKTQLGEHKTQLGEHKTRMEEHKARMDGHNDWLGEHNTRLEDYGTGLDEHRTQLGDHDTRLTEQLRRLNLYKERHEDADNRLDGHDKALAGYDTTLAGHNKALAGHDTALGDHAARLDTNARRIQEQVDSLKGHQTSLEDHDKQLRAHRSRLDGYEGQLQGHDDQFQIHRGRLQHFDGRLDGLDRGITTLTEGQATQQGQITTLTEEQAAQQGQITTLTEGLAAATEAQNNRPQTEADVPWTVQAELARLHGARVLREAERQQARDDIGRLNARTEATDQRADYVQEWIQEVTDAKSDFPRLRGTRRLPHLTRWQQLNRALREVEHSFQYLFRILAWLLGIMGYGGILCKTYVSFGLPGLVSFVATCVVLLTLLVRWLAGY